MMRCCYYTNSSNRVVVLLWGLWFTIYNAANIIHVVEANDSAINEPFSSSYSSLDHAPCVTLYHRNGRTGCGTFSRSVQKGLVKYFDGNSGLPRGNEEYVAVIEDYKLTADTMDTLLKANGGLLQGVLVLNSTSNDEKDTDVDHRSPDSVYPQGYGTPSQNINYGYIQYPWNGRGEGLFNYDFHGMPMAYAKDSDVSSTIRQAAKQSAGLSSSNNKGSYTPDNVVAEFNYYMGPDGEMTSLQCLAWKDAGTDEWNPKCLPLGGTSVWAAAGSPPAESSSSSSSNNNNQNGNNSKRPVIMVGAGMDSTSLFHDISPGANTAASNILTLVMAAKILGENVNDETLDALNNQIVFSLFQGESYGMVGSRNFFRDVGYPGFECYDANGLVRAVPRLGEQSEWACLNPLYPSTKFSDLGQVTGMIAVDQVGVTTADNFLFVHADQDNDNFGGFLANVLLASGTSSFSVVATSAEANDNNGGYPYPPSPLTSLLSLSEGAAGGAVLTGYDYAFTTHSPYHSHMASSHVYEMNYKAIAAAATIVARAALAAAYDGGDYDYETSSAYALNLIPTELSYQDETLLRLGDCLFYNGECDMIKDYASVTTNTEKSLTGFNLGTGASLGVPPNYYVGVYNGLYGQPFVQVGDNVYGRYDGEDFGKKKSDAISLQPRALENAIHGMMNDFLGRGANNFAASSCKKHADCSNVEFCINNGDTPTCTGGGVCVCRRAHFHAALDEALLPAKNDYTGKFVGNSNEQGYSPIYTEPYWSNSVGVRVYRDAGQLPGLVTLAVGAVVAALSFCASFVLRVGLKKEKLY